MLFRRGVARRSVRGIGTDGPSRRGGKRRRGGAVRHRPPFARRPAVRGAPRGGEPAIAAFAVPRGDGARVDELLPRRRAALRPTWSTRRRTTSRFAMPSRTRPALPNRRAHPRFCIDRYEYPNRKGAHPAWMLDWYQAQATCESDGKRLCWASEWTAACEGPEHTPFPYGWARDHDNCNMDNFYIDPKRPSPHGQFFFYSKNRDVALPELSRLDQSVPCGSMESCKSGFGVYDMTGNVDEWVTSDEPPHEKFAVGGPQGGRLGPRAKPVQADDVQPRARLCLLLRGLSLLQGRRRRARLDPFPRRHPRPRGPSPRLRAHRNHGRERGRPVPHQMVPLGKDRIAPRLTTGSSDPLVRRRRPEPRCRPQRSSRRARWRRGRARPAFPAGGLSGGAAALPPGRSGPLCGGCGAERAKRVEAEQSHSVARASRTGPSRAKRVEAERSAQGYPSNKQE